MRYYDQEGSYRLFLALEGNKDGMGSWKIQDTLGCAWIDLPERLRADLMTWRWMMGITETLAEKDKPKPGAEAEQEF